MSTDLDLSDLVQEAIDEPRYTSTRAAAGAAGPSAVKTTIPHQFCVKLLRLLTTLADVFPERTALTDWIALMKATIMDIPAMEKWAIEKWHYEMTYDEDGILRSPSLYQLTADRDIDAVFAAKVWVFEAIDGRAMYEDPGLDADDREKICGHFDAINAQARLFASVPETLMEAVQAIDHDPTQPVTMETVQGAVQSIIGCSVGELGRNPEAMEKMMGWARHLTSSFCPTTDEEDPDPTTMLSKMTAKGGLLDSLTSMMSGLGQTDISVKDLVSTAAAELEESRRLVAGVSSVADVD